MGNQELFNIIIGASGFLFGFMLKMIWDNIDKIKEELKEIHRDYARRDDYKEDIAEIKKILHEIFDKLYGKADK